MDSACTSFASLIPMNELAEVWQLRGNAEASGDHENGLILYDWCAETVRSAI